MLQAYALEPDAYVVAFVSPDLCNFFWSGKYRPDYLIGVENWSSLPEILREVKEKSGDKVILLDFHVHGNTIGDGLWLQTRNESNIVVHTSRASFGYVLNTIERELAGKRILLFFETCYAGRAYKNSIRGAVKYNDPGKANEELLEDYLKVPPYPIYGPGDSFSTISQMMYIQLIYNFRRWWVNLVDYDKLGKNIPLLPVEKEHSGWSKSTLEMLQTWRFFTFSLP